MATDSVWFVGTANAARGHPWLERTQAEFRNRRTRHQDVGRHADLVAGKPGHAGQVRGRHAFHDAPAHEFRRPHCATRRHDPSIARGRGIMTEVLAAVTAYAMRTHELTRVYAVPYQWSAASCRVLEKVGYVCEGRMRRSAIKDGRVVDQLLYALVVDPDVGTGRS